MALRGPMLLGFPNIVAQPYCTVTTPATAAGLVPAGFEPSYLKTEEPSEKARVATLDPKYTRWDFAFGKTVQRDFDGFAVVAPNLSPWGRYRIVTNTHAYVTTAPNNVAASTNVTGAVGNVDEAISSPDASFMTPTTTTSAWSVNLDFATPATAPVTGAGMAMFVLRVLLVGTPVATYPRLLVGGRDSLTELPTDLGTRAITSSTGSGQVLIFPFAPFGPADGSRIGIRIDGEPGDSGSYCKLEACILYTETVVPAKDSGWLASPVASYSDDDDPPPTISLPYYPAAAWTSQSGVSLLIADDQTEHDPDTGGAAAGVPIANLLSLPSGYVEAGVFCGGGALAPRGIRHGGGPGVEVLVEQRGGTSVAGQTYGADGFRRRSMSWDLMATRDELLALMNRIAWRRGQSGAFFVSAEPDIAVARQLFESFWATARVGRAAPLPVRHDQGAGTMPWSAPFDFEEKL
jgi:hypothetical protein